MYNTRCVMRCNTCEIYDYPRLTEVAPEIQIRPWLSRIGTSSWVMSFELLDSDAQGGAVVGHAATVMVSVDAEVRRHGCNIIFCLLAVVCVVLPW